MSDAPSSGSPERRFEFHVEGRVQGVAFRAFTRDAARRLGLAGFVENLADGRVHGVASGPDEALAEFRDFLDRGSPWAKVLDVQWVERAADGDRDPRPFAVRR